jgi:glycosyltransferase involved in cell wall biosynthesis
MTALTVSVIIPVFNGERYLASTVESVLGQSRAPLEIVFINDGSTDDSARIIAELIERSDASIPIRVVEQVNSGQSAARNAGAAVATGDLIAFLDQDDRWAKEHLEELVVPFAQYEDMGWAYSDFDEIDQDSLLVTRHFMLVHEVPQGKTTISQLLSNDLMILPSASVMRARAFAEVGGFYPGLRGYEDDELFIRFFRAGWRSAYLAKSLTQFRVHSQSSSARSLFRESRMVFFRRMCELLPDDPRLGRYYITDVLKPRLLASTLHEYSSALSQHRDSEIAAIVESVSELMHSSAVGPRGRRGLWVLSRPRLARRLLRFRARLWPSLRPQLPEGLGLRE